MFNWFKSWKNAQPLPSEDLKVIPFALRDFHSLRVGSALDVEISEGDYRVHATIPENLIKHLIIETRGGVLHLSLKGSVESTKSIAINVQMPRITRLEAFDACYVQASTTTSHDLHVQTHGASTVCLYGEGIATEFNASDASTLDASHFSAQISNCVASGAATLETHATQSVHAKAKDASSIVIKGRPGVKTTKKDIAATIHWR